jgi:hypothetical protein
MIAIALGQAIMSFNVASMPVRGMVQSFGVPPTTVGTGIVMYSLAVAVRHVGRCPALLRDARAAVVGVRRRPGADDPARRDCDAGGQGSRASLPR